MNRIDRLTGMILLLQSHRVITAEQIAAHFEMSMRTVYRDLAALGEAGVPIVAEAMTKMRPQSVMPKRSTSRPRSTYITSSGTMLMVKIITRPTSYGFSLKVNPVIRWISQYSPASNVANNGGLLE